MGRGVGGSEEEEPSSHREMKNGLFLLSEVTAVSPPDDNMSQSFKKDDITAALGNTQLPHTCCTLSISLSLSLSLSLYLPLVVANDTYEYEY